MDSIIETGPVNIFYNTVGLLLIKLFKLIGRQNGITHYSIDIQNFSSIAHFIHDGSPRKPDLFFFTE